MNIASFFGDFSHVVAIFLLLGWIIHGRSCEGISGKMQILYAIIFTARYLDLLTFQNMYLAFMKIFLILISYVTVMLIYVVYKKTYEREYDAFWIETLIVLSLGLGLLECRDITAPEEVLWTFSRYLEAVTFVPQLYFTYKKEIKSNIISYYVIALILYRGFYICSWIISYQETNYFNAYSVYPGLVQFFIYFIYFFLPYGPTTSILPTTTVQVDADQNQPIPTPRSPYIARQESLLESPFLKRNANSYSSIYSIIYNNNSNNSSPDGSVKSLNFPIKEEGRY